MKANWKARNKQYNDRQKGEIFDVGIGYGLEFQHRLYSIIILDSERKDCISLISRLFITFTR